MIEKMREKRAFEESLPSLDQDPKKWRQMKEEHELKEFLDREAKIQQLQQAKLDLLKAAIAKRDGENDFIAQQRIEEIRDRLMQQREARTQESQVKRIKGDVEEATARSRRSDAALHQAQALPHRQRP